METIHTAGYRHRSFPGYQLIDAGTNEMLRIRRGLDIPIAGAPRLLIDTGKPVHSVAVIGFDYHGLKPTMAVLVGDRVK